MLETNWGARAADPGSLLVLGPVEASLPPFRVFASLAFLQGYSE
jgi:hypothetical protein